LVLDDGNHPQRGRNISDIYNLRFVLDKRTPDEPKTPKCTVNTDSYKNVFFGNDLLEFDTAILDDMPPPLAFKFKPLSKLDQERYHYSQFPMHPQPNTSDVVYVKGIEKPVRMLSLNGVSAHDIVQRHDCVERFLNCETPSMPRLVHGDSSPDGFSQPLFYPDSWSHAPRPVNPSEVLNGDDLVSYIKSNKRVTETVNEDNPCVFVSSHPYKEGFEEMFQWINFYEKLVHWHDSLSWKSDAAYQLLSETKKYKKISVPSKHGMINFQPFL
jgi:hypothetical protein